MTEQIFTSPEEWAEHVDLSRPSIVAFPPYEGGEERDVSDFREIGAIDADDIPVWARKKPRQACAWNRRAGQTTKQ